MAHQQINGYYQTKMAMDSFPVLGHQVSGYGAATKESVLMNR